MKKGQELTRRLPSYLAPMHGERRKRVVLDIDERAVGPGFEGLKGPHSWTREEVWHRHEHIHLYKGTPPEEKRATKRKSGSRVAKKQGKPAWAKIVQKVCFCTLFGLVLHRVFFGPMGG